MVGFNNQVQNKPECRQVVLVLISNNDHPYLETSMLLHVLYSFL